VLQLHPLPFRFELEEAQAALFDDVGGNGGLAVESLEAGELAAEETGLAVALAVVDEKPSSQVAGRYSRVGRRSRK
jgi:hypothetical protein